MIKILDVNHSKTVAHMEELLQYLIKFMKNYSTIVGNCFSDCLFFSNLSDLFNTQLRNMLPKDKVSAMIENLIDLWHILHLLISYLLYLTLVNPFKYVLFCDCHLMAHTWALCFELSFFLLNCLLSLQQ